MLIAPRTVTLASRLVVELRSLTEPDADEALAYIRALTRQSMRNLANPPEHFDAMTVEAERAFIGLYAEHPRALLLGAFDGARMVGNASLEPSPGTFAAHAATLGLGVLESHRGLGLGRALSTTLLAEGAALGIDNVLLRVRTFNAPAIALYASLGFRLVGTLRDAAKLPDGYADEHLFQLCPER